jgi:flavin reductase (DIM6/NTAB) family NADH-FMN oxidoreductase RutF
MIRKKPWNRVNLPVYSVSSKHANQANMHICTYVTAVSMKPKRFMVALYHGTLTLELVLKEKEFVLQILKEDQYNLVKLLGQQSGHSIDKIKRLEKRKLLTKWEDYQILTGCLAAMKLSVLSQTSGGDHEMFLCDLVTYKNFNEGKELSLEVLSQKNIIRI